MTVRVKFYVTSITSSMSSGHYVEDAEKGRVWKSELTEVQTIKLNPVTSGSPENNAFYDATPSGTIELGILNQQAYSWFELGKSYYVDFTPAE